jgi:hypothetical protein
MPMRVRHDVTSAFRKKADDLRKGIQALIPLAAEVVRDGIIQTTLAGIGANDAPFKPYSPAYQALIDSVGGKPSGGVDLRGIFVKEGAKKTRTFKDPKREAKRQRNALAKGIGRRAFVQVSIGDTTFTAQTKPTRPRMGLVDPQSEMSADLIKITVTANGFRLDYSPRQRDYMTKHNETRPWFSTAKTPIKAAFAEVLRVGFRALIQNFNS